MYPHDTNLTCLTYKTKPVLKLDVLRTKKHSDSVLPRFSFEGIARQEMDERDKEIEREGEGDREKEIGRER